jgi:hypothetical protein
MHVCIEKDKISKKKGGDSHQTFLIVVDTSKKSFFGCGNR